MIECENGEDPGRKGQPGLPPRQARADATLVNWAGFQPRSLGKLVDEAGEDLGQRCCGWHDARAYRCIRAGP
jgi:hypothetical protein